MFSFLMNLTRAKSPSNFDRGKAIEIEVKFQNERKIDRVNKERWRERGRASQRWNV